MKILIAGIDGYIGYPLALHLMKRGHEVCGIDNYSRRRLVHAAGSDSLTPILDAPERERYLRSNKNFYEEVARINLTDAYKTNSFLAYTKPDSIVHLAEQPSAPWSMKSRITCIETQVNNVAGTLSLLWAMRKHCPNAHLVKLGTMGEYGTPECDIPEGSIPDTCIRGNWNPPVECPMAGLPFPRSPGSFYHLSKAHDTHNIIFACQAWGLCSTDIMQGPVFGVTTGDELDSRHLTRFDYDQYFGTVINRFCAQAIIDHPLTIYGSGDQVRGYIPLKDSIQCLTLSIENPPSQGEYRVFNQFESTRSINEIAAEVSLAADVLGIEVRIDHLKNPRTEADKHYYNPAHQGLLVLGYKPTTNFSREVFRLLNDILPYRQRVKKEVIMPTTNWR